MSIDLRHALRRRKPAKHVAPLAERSRDALLSWDKLNVAAPLALVLDTNVYIGRASGRLSGKLRDLIDGALLFHSSVALAELATGIGNADPAAPRWPTLRDHYADLFAAVPATRLLTPDAQIWADAGLIAGLLARIQRLQPHQRKECLNDTLILLTAAKAGLAVLTSNRGEFDLIQQIAPEVRFVYY